MTARAVLYAPSGTLRVWWRVAGFLLVFFAADQAVSAVAHRLPVPASFTGQLTIAFGSVLAAAALATWVMLRRVDDRAWSTAFLGKEAARPRLLGAGLALGAFGILLPSGLLVAAGWMRVAPAQTAAVSGAGPALFALQAAVLFLPQSLAEELLSRGYAFNAIREAAGPAAAIAVSSLVFGALHLGNPGADFRSFANVVVAGVWLGAIVVVTRSVYAAWMAHFAWNFAIAGVLHAPLSGIPFPTPAYALTADGPAWATGGRWGPEGSAFAALSMLAMTALLARRATGGAPRLEAAHG